MSTANRNSTNFLDYLYTDTSVQNDHRDDSSQDNDLAQMIEGEISTSVTAASVPSNEEGEPRKKSSNAEVKQNIVEIALDSLRERYHFLESEDQLYVYEESEGYWKLIYDTVNNRELRRMLPMNLRGKVGKYALSDVYECLVTSATHVPANFFDKHTEYINFRDLAFNWCTGEKTVNRKEMYFRYALAVDYPTGKSTGAFKKFTKDVFGDDKDTRKEFYKFIGLCLSGIRELKLAYFLFGPSNTGKTVVMNLLQEIIGKNNTSTLSFSQMDTEFATHLLHGKRLNVSGEISGTTAKRLDAWKSITGNDHISANRKGMDYVEFRNRCILVFGANTLPDIKDKTEVESFVSRLIIFPFSHPVPRERWDHQLHEKLMEDIADIVAQSVEGLKTLAKDGYAFNESEAMKNCKKQYSHYHDSFTPFMEKYLVSDTGNKLSTQEIEDAYRKYCDIKGYPVLASNVWIPLLVRKFPVGRTSVKKSENETKRVRGFVDINFSSKIEGLLGEGAVSLERSLEDILNMKEGNSYED